MKINYGLEGCVQCSLYLKPRNHMTLEANLPISLEIKWAWLSSRSHWTPDRKRTSMEEPGVKADGVRFQFFLANNK